MSGSILLGIGYFALGIPGHLPAWRVESAAFCMFITGFAVSMLTAPISTYLMEVTPRHMLGRIGALMTVACTAAIPVGSLITGFVAEHYSSHSVFDHGIHHDARDIPHSEEEFPCHLNPRRFVISTFSAYNEKK